MHIPAYTYLRVRLLLQSECTLHSLFGGATVFVVPKLVTHILTLRNITSISHHDRKVKRWGNCLFTCKSEEQKTYLVSEVEFPSWGIHGRLDTLGSQATNLQEIDEV